MIVDVVLMPSAWASVVIRTQSAVDTFLGQIFALT
jgi:hypothetical protein